MLNACPKCQRTFPVEDGNFCPNDATHLEPIARVPVPPDPRDPLVGATLAGRYELRRTIADGGMGRVYEAHEVTGHRRVAVKVLHAEIAEDEVNIERFRREAGTSRDLDHAYIVDVYDFDHAAAPGRDRPVWYMAMEYLDGEELRAVLSREKILPVPRVIRLVSQVAMALDPAHQRGFVHRDLKPDNVFLVRSAHGDHVKLLDFGSVKFTKGQDKGNKLTVMGTTIGSPYYMAPEQAEGSPDLDHRADVWALGAIVYEATVGQVPFHAPTGPQILFKILGDEHTPPTFANEGAPPELDDFAHKALQKKPANRFQTCGELADALGHAFGLEGTHADWAARDEAALAADLQSARARKAEAAARPPAVSGVLPRGAEVQGDPLPAEDVTARLPVAASYRALVLGAVAVLVLTVLIAVAMHFK